MSGGSTGGWCREADFGRSRFYCIQFYLMNISVDQWRISIGLFHGNKGKGVLVQLHFVSFPILLDMLTNLFRILQHVFYSHFHTIGDKLDNSHITFIILTLLLIAFDIEQNPGPPNISADLSILHKNMRSIRNKNDFIKDNFLDFNILCFSETHSDPLPISNDNLFLSDTYDDPYRKDRTNHGGGLLINLNTELVYTRRQDLETYCEESIWVEIKVTNNIYLLGLFYSPRTVDTNFFDDLNKNIEKAYDFTKHLLIVGDLNEDLLNPNFHNLKDLRLLNSFENVINEPTRQQAILDPTIISDDLAFLESGTITTPQLFLTTKQLLLG